MKTCHCGECGHTFQADSLDLCPSCGSGDCLEVAVEATAPAGRASGTGAERGVLVSRDGKCARAIISILVDEDGDGMTCEHGGRLSRAEVLFWIEKAKMSFLDGEWGAELPSDVGASRDAQ